jgi:hypothetical protein
MVISETIVINGEEYLHTYSDQGFTVERDGAEYSDAIDPIDSGRVYTETKNKIDSEHYEPNENEPLAPDEISPEEFMSLVEEAL